MVILIKIHSRGSLIIQYTGIVNRFPVSAEMDKNKDH